MPPRHHVATEVCLWRDGSVAGGSPATVSTARTVPRHLPAAMCRQPEPDSLPARCPKGCVAPARQGCSSHCSCHPPREHPPSVPAMRESLAAHGTVPRQSPLPSAGARSSLRSAEPRRSQRAAGAEGPAGRARCHPAPAETPRSREPALIKRAPSSGQARRLQSAAGERPVRSRGGVTPAG